MAIQFSPASGKPATLRFGNEQKAGSDTPLTRGHAFAQFRRDADAAADSSVKPEKKKKGGMFCGGMFCGSYFGQPMKTALKIAGALMVLNVFPGIGTLISVSGILATLAFGPPVIAQISALKEKLGATHS